jgi:hypothetical protein
MSEEEAGLNQTKPGTGSCSCCSVQESEACTCSDTASCSCDTEGSDQDRLSCTCASPPLPLQEVLTTTSDLTVSDRLDHFLARWGVNRMGHRVKPGLYRLGSPTPDSPVFVSANYSLSFDALRSALSATDAYLLVLDTRGINVWCAAGKGTFGTEELVERIARTGLSSVVRHRTLIVPQLGAPGISAHQVRKESGFRVEYGPVRARDLPEYLKTRTATTEMRRIRFPFRDRVVLTPVELVHAALPATAAAVLLYFLAGTVAALAAIAAVLAGTVLFPALLPFLPTKDFSTKGMILGIVIALPFAAYGATQAPLSPWATIVAAIIPLLLIPVVTGYLALNFTGCTPYASRTGVRTEIFRYVPVMAVMAVSGIVLAILLGLLWVLGVA